MRAILFAALPAALIACATTGDPDDTGEAGCFDGKCDGSVVWKYEAGKTPWVTCEHVSNKVTCRLDMTPKGVQPTQAMLNKGDVPFYYPTPLTPEAPRFTLPDSFSGGEPIAILARAPMTGLGDVRKLLPAPSAGKSATYFAPFDIWRVSVTSVGADVGTLILRYSVQITGAQFMLTQSQKTDFFGALSVTPGPAGESRSQTYFLPASPGGKISAYYDAGAIGGPPQLTIEKPGCYLMQGTPAILTFDEGCVKTRELVPPTPEPTSCACDVSSACDANCACDAACTQPQGPVCVAGTQYECDDAGEMWTGSQCCVSGNVQCVAGSQYECDDSGEHWTGSQCCVDGPTQCVQGTQYECDDAGETWTGSTCCISPTAMCLSGTQYECDDSGESWTGTQCCLAAQATCVAGSQYECDDAGESWTGTQCCLALGSVCVAGSQYECDDAGESWTGSQCCVAAGKTCTAGGSASTCTSGGGLWTGSQCCR